MPWRLDASGKDFAGAFARLLAARAEAAEDVTAVAASIVADVRARGEEALLELTRRFDGWDAPSAAALRVGAGEVRAAAAALPGKIRAALDLAASRIEAFHRAQLPEDKSWKDKEGAELGWRWTPIESVGLYVPGGTAAYPSSVLMNAIPAKVAGVGRLVMTVPAPKGAANPLVLAAAARAGVDEVWRVGGAQAVAALAYGTAGIAKVDKIVGPGNAYVAAAKRIVFGQVGIDLIAGPSEIVVVADRDNDPAWIAADLLSQAEHDDRAQAVLIADEADFARAVDREVAALLARMPRAAIVRASWERHGAIILVASLGDAPAIVDRLAPEHVELCVAEPAALAKRIRHAGAIFMGRHTPEAVGDYVAGPNHVLPTSGAARFSSGLGVGDFLKRTTLLACSPAALAAIGPAAVALAEAEGFYAHALSVSLRLKGR